MICLSVYLRSQTDPAVTDGSEHDQIGGAVDAPLGHVIIRHLPNGKSEMNAAFGHHEEAFVVCQGALGQERRRIGDPETGKEIALAEHRTFRIIALQSVDREIRGSKQASDEQEQHGGSVVRGAL